MIIDITLLSIALASLLVFAALMVRVWLKRRRGVAAERKHGFAAHSLEQAYVRSRDHLTVTRDLVCRLKNEAVEGVERTTDEEKRRVAYHEVGHALMAAHCERVDTVHRISIVPRGRAALGYTLQLPTQDQFLTTRGELLERITCLLAGRAAEEIVFREVSTGAQNDLERATALVPQMVTWYGMSERIGLAHCAQRPATYLGAADVPLQRDCSEQTAWEIDEEVKAILARAYADARRCLRQHRETLDRIAAKLLTCEKIDGAEFYRMVGQSEPCAPAHEEVANERPLPSTAYA